MKFAGTNHKQLAPGLARIACVAWALVVLAVFGSQANAEIVVVQGVHGISEGRAVSGEVDLRAHVVGNPDMVLFELVGPTEVFHARYGRNPSFKVDSETGESIPWDTTQVPDGDYVLRVTAVSADGEDRTLSYKFPVRNNLTEPEQTDSIGGVTTSQGPSSSDESDLAARPQVVVLNQTESQTGPRAVLDDLRAAQILPVVVFADQPSSYTQGSGQPVRIELDGPMPSDGSIVAIAWNNDESRIIDGFAHTLDPTDPVILPEFMDQLPAGATQLQLLVRRSSQVHRIVRLNLEVLIPQAPAQVLPELALVQPPAEFERGAAGSIAVTVDGLMPEGADILVLAWSRAEQRMVEEFAFVLGDDMEISGSALDQLPAGENQIQLLLRIENVVQKRVNHLIVVNEPPAPVEPETVQLPAVGFGVAPAVYHVGSGVELPLSVSGPMPAGGNVVVIAWSDTQQKMVDAFAMTLDGDDWRIPASQLDLLPEGETQLQLLVRLDNEIQSIVTHTIQVAPAASQPDPPQTGGAGLPAVAFSNAPTQYIVGSGQSVSIQSTGDFTTGSDLLVIAWSVDENRLVDAFAFTMSDGPFAISSASMDLLPAGEVILQLLPREDNDAYAQIVHRLTVVHGADSGGEVGEPTPDVGDSTDPDAGGGSSTDDGSGGDSADGSDEPGDEDPQPQSYDIAFSAAAPSTHVRGADTALVLTVSSELPGGATVQLRAWSVQSGTYVNLFERTLGAAPWRVEAADLDRLSDGEYRIDAALRLPGLPQVVARHSITISPPANAGDDVTPQTPRAGFTAYNPSADTQVVYVANDGDDSNNGLSPLTPVRTLDHAANLMRDGKPDWLLLKRGDTFDLPGDEGGDFRYWQPSGRSHDEPMIVGAYGDPIQPRPRIHTNGRGALRSVKSSHLVFRDLHFNANLRDPHGAQFDGGGEMETGVSINRTDDLRFEGCLVEYFSMNMMFRDGSNENPPLGGIVLHRCVIRNAYAHGQEDSSGMYFKLADGVTLSECIIDHNGWDEDVPQSVRRGRNHNVYFSDCTNITVTGCIFARESYLALKIRSERERHCQNVTVSNNLFLQCAFPLDFGANGSDDQINFVNLVVKDNVFARTTGWPLDAPRGRGMKLSRCEDGQVSGNLFIDNGPNGPEKNEACRIDGETHLQDIMVYDNDAVLPLQEGEELFSTHYRQRNPHDDITFVNNRENVLIARYVDPTVHFEAYLSQIGASSIDAFLDRASAMQAVDWDDRYTAAALLPYYRDGFELTPFD